MKIHIRLILIVIVVLSMVPLICQAQALDQDSKNLMTEICQTCDRLFPLVENSTDTTDIQRLIETVMYKMMRVRFQYSQMEISKQTFCSFSAAKVSLLQKDSSAFKQHLAKAKTLFDQLVALSFFPAPPMTVEEAIRRILVFKKAYSGFNLLTETLKSKDECGTKMNIIMKSPPLCNHARFTFDKASGHLDFIYEINGLGVPSKSWPIWVDRFNALFK
ncbi:MAG: hypothetical protein WA705_04340 [Candidatus Ozemobacteraceae bacterium]